MDDSTSLIYRFLMSGVAGCGATVKPQIAAQQFLAMKGAISWSEYANRVATLVSDRTLYAQLLSFYKLQAVGWGLTILASGLYW